MIGLISGAIWAGLVAYLLYRALRQFRAFRLAKLPILNDSLTLPAVAIIVPARNEIDNISACLGKLSTQTGFSDESSIIIVNDNSQDGTVSAVERAAAADPRIRLLEAGPLPECWLGKPLACWRGALRAEGDWLCFIDADVRAGRGLISAAIRTAEAQGIDMLSLHPRQELGSFWERVIFPAGLLVLACAKSFDSASENIVNGQFLLVRRDAYFNVGGHAAVRGEISEDKALAARIRRSGFKIRVFSGEHLARTRMYRNLRSLWEGLSKNAIEVLGSRVSTLLAAAASFIFGWIALLLPPAAACAAYDQPSWAALAGAALGILSSAVVVGIHFGTTRHFRIPAAFALTFVLGYTAVACLACRAVLADVKGRVTWKGRTYRLTKTSPEGT
jgi:chlorobactene glucosyltransferase